MADNGGHYVGQIGGNFNPGILRDIKAMHGKGG